MVVASSRVISRDRSVIASPFSFSDPVVSGSEVVVTCYHWQVSQCAAIAFTDVARYLEFFVRRVRVEGPSMIPTYRPGETLTALRRWRRVRPGDVVVVRDPRDERRWLLKRCVATRGALVELRGDNAMASTDSRDFGPVKRRDVRWIVVDALSAVSPGPVREKGH